MDAAGRRWTETDAESFSRIAVGLARCLRVDGERRARVGVAEARLGGLDVDLLLDQRGRGRPSQVVILELRKARGRDGWEPRPLPPVAVVEARPVVRNEDEGVGVGSGELPAGEVL
jgi:hypothetical protein